MFTKKIKKEELDQKIVIIKKILNRSFTFRFDGEATYYSAPKPKYFNWGEASDGDTVRLSLTRTIKTKDTTVLRIVENLSTNVKYTDELPDLVSIRELKIENDAPYIIMHIEENVIGLLTINEVQYIRRPKGESWAGIVAGDDVRLTKFDMGTHYELRVVEVL